MSQESPSANPTHIDPKWYRQVLAQYPTGVCAITACQPDGGVLGIIVGSFTSVSLDPPLVAFLPDRTSSTWAKLRHCPRFCVNILSAEQEPVCRQLASRAADKFASVRYTSSPGGAPIIDGAVAWIDCAVYRIDEAGDHDIVLGLVEHLEIAEGGLPLLFFQGGYGRFAPASLAAANNGALVSEQFRILDRSRPEMEHLAQRCSARCTAIARVGDEILIVAMAGQARHHGPTTVVGQRLPFVPVGTVLAAWLPQAEADRWIAEAVDPSARAACQAALPVVRRRGLSIGLESAPGTAPAGGGHGPDLPGLVATLRNDPSDLSGDQRAAVRLIGAPVFDSSGNAAMALLLDDFPAADESGTLAGYATLLREASQRVTASLAASGSE